MSKNTDQLIYIVEDDVPMNTMLCKYLQKKGFNRVIGFDTGEAMLEEIRTNEPVVIIQDFDLPGLNGLEVFHKVIHSHPDAEFIFLSGQGSIKTALEAIKNGAFDYIVKDNFAKENVLTKINNLHKIKELSQEKQRFKRLVLFLILLLFCSWILIFILYL